LSLGLAVAAVVALAGFLAAQPPLPGRPDADPLTTLASLLGDLAGRLAGAATLGGLAAVFAFLPRSGADPRVVGRLARWTGRAAQVWCVAAVWMTVANPTFVTGTPLGSALQPQAWWYYLTSTPSALAWLVTAVVALATTLAAYLAPRPAVLLLCWFAGAGATVFVAVTGNVSVGLDHDWATDAAAVASLALAVLASGAVGLTATVAAGAGLHPAAARRYQRLAAPAVAIAAAGLAVVAWQQLAGVAVLDTPAGIPVLTGFACLAGLAAAWGWRQARPDRTELAGRGYAVDVALLVGPLASLTAAQHFPPPRFLVPQSIQVNYLGYEVDVPATLERLAGLGRPNLLWVVLVVAAVGGYLWGMVRVHRSGGRWPVWRLVLWLAGWGLTCYLAVSGLWMYSTAVFSWHMLVHMTINMMVPVLCVLGAPFALAEAASRPATDTGLAGPSELLAGVAGNRVVRRLLSPPVLWLVYLGSLFLVYFTPLFPWLMKYHWAHQLMLLHFMVAGLAFFSLVAGPGTQLWRLPYLVRFALLVSVMPFHAIFAVGIMTARSVIGENFYRTLDVAWVGDLLADQGIAGQVTWFTGEVPALVAVIALAAQWFRSDRGEAAAADARQDLGGADELTAYNDMLAALAERDRVEHGSGPGRSA
ncbi:MAG: cytochrome c oxidase assembly protein, partial [Propionicimonas sp.]|nr:cytochrome c oxidase assembly protein [Propionicimonas sp.]